MVNGYGTVLLRPETVEWVAGCEISLFAYCRSCVEREFEVFQEGDIDKAVTRLRMELCMDEFGRTGRANPNAVFVVP